MSYDYTIDGDPVTWTGLIKEAKARGHDCPDGLYTTSGAAQFLREQGCEVDYYREKD